MRVKKASLLQVAWVIAISTVVSAGISCLSNPCQHGICIDDVNSTYSCYCVDGYTGVMCQTNWDECWSAPCLNGGTCVDGIAAYNCSCPDGFIGYNCEINYNECASNPCENNGTCIDMTNGYVCSCLPGFSGDHCEMDIAVCNATEEVRCHNGGQCIEGLGFKFYCKCPPGWTGKKCEDQIDECESDPCQNGGVCIDMHADYMCACAYGFTGKSCEVQIEFCENNACSQNAVCVVEEGSKVCYCVPDYHGERCELQYDECALGPRCMNGGTCIDGVDNFTCSCPPNLTGPLCECLVENGTLNCEYIRPMISPDLSTTTFIEELLTTEYLTTTFMEAYNDSIPRTKTIVFETTDLLPREITTEVSTYVTPGQIDLDTDTTTLSSTTTDYGTTKLTLVISEKREETTTESDKKTESTIKMPTTLELETTISTFAGTTFDTETTTNLLPITTEITTEKFVENTTPVIEVVQTTEKVTTAMVTVASKTETTTERRLDTTTEQLFTDTPTELATDLSLTTVYSTTEETIKTTEIDSTVFITTTASYCSDTVCNNHGNCVNSPHGVRCHCVFNYGGKFCDEEIVISSAAFGGRSYVSHRIRNDTSISIELNAKTLMNDGQIMYVDIAKGVYMQLYMNFGLLKFKFSCGYQTMLLSELKTLVNKGYQMKIEARLDVYLKEQHCNATLRLNDTLAMSGGQVAKVDSLEHNTTLFLGNAPDLMDVKTMPFVGCIKDLVVNGEIREIFGDAIGGSEITECLSLSCLSNPCLNGGSCRDDRDAYYCSCSNGWMGHHCNQSVCENNPCQSGGSCIRHPGSGFLCLCPYGKHGIFCEYNVEITRPSLAPVSFGMSSFLVYPLSPSAMNSDRFDLRLRFHTTDMEQIALLAFVGQNGLHDSHSQHLALTFVKGYIMLTWNMGNGPRRIFTSRALATRRGGHSVRVWRRGRSAGLSVDQRHNVSGNAPHKHDRMTLLPYLYIGGHPSVGFADLPHDLPMHSGFNGCVFEVGGQAVGSGKAVGGRGVGQCGVSQCTVKSCNSPRGVCVQSPASYGCICNEGWYGATCSSQSSPCDSSTNRCKGRCVITSKEPQCDCPYGKTGPACEQDLIPTDVLFTGVRSYIQLHARSLSSVSISIQMEIKPTKERGLLVFARTPHFYTTLSLQGGLLEYRWTDQTSGVTSLVRSGVVVSVSQWHVVKAGRYGSRLYVWADGTLTTEPMVARAYPHTVANATLLLGGASDLSSLPFDATSGPTESYQGCIRNVHINNVLLPLEPHNIKEGQNVADCDGTACGVELCGGGACAVDGAHARCQCPAGGTSARCARHAACSGAVCKPPNGLCRKGRCVCYAGFAGVHCERKINVTIPQFDGEAFLAARRGPSDRRAGAQRVSHALPSYVHLNFTTAEPHGLLLWIAMGKDYIGIGLENGFLKLVLSFYPSNSTVQVPHSKRSRNEPAIFSRLVPQAGYLADAEWHTIELRIEKKNITFTVDKQHVYVEEMSLKLDAYYLDADIFIGGITERESGVAKKVYPHNWRGCIGQISLEEHSYVTNYTDVYSENVQSCQLFP